MTNNMHSACKVETRKHKPLGSGHLQFRRMSTWNKTSKHHNNGVRITSHWQTDTNMTVSTSWKDHKIHNIHTHNCFTAIWILFGITSNLQITAYLWQWYITKICWLDYSCYLSSENSIQQSTCIRPGFYFFSSY